MLNQIHLLLTYRCDFECDHCFLYCSPRAKGTFTREQIAEVLEQAEALGTIEWIYFEGGEPFLVYPLMIEGIRMASAKGFKTGIVSQRCWSGTICNRSRRQEMVNFPSQPSSGASTLGRQTN